MKGARVVCVVQARTRSTRLPAKIFKEIAGFSCLELIFRRLSKSGLCNQFVLATTDKSEDDRLAEEALSVGFEVYRGSANDVLSRFYNLSLEYCPSYVVRITGDCPLVDAKLVDTALESLIANDVDYVSNSHPPRLPDGFDVECFSANALKLANSRAYSVTDREHVTPILLRATDIKKIAIEYNYDYSHYRFTIDESIDLAVVRDLCSHFEDPTSFGWDDVRRLLDKNGEKFLTNATIPRNEGASMPTGQKLWRRANEVILGGSSLLSKNPDRFLPDLSPAYYSSAKGCCVTDLENNSYLDMGLMGVGTSALGYANDEINAAVSEAVSRGVMSSLLNREEVDLAERLLSLHSWGGKVKFARSGGEANALAIRIARAAAAKEVVAVCGYHGWHDWYLAVNLHADEGLDDLLLPGLKPKGVPKYLTGSTVTFPYGDIDGFKDVLSSHDVGVVKMEIARSSLPDSLYLQEIRSLTHKAGAVLIFDECTSGFRESLGGIHLKTGVSPDICVFGKTLGNGHPITAVVGADSVMSAAQDSFISSTFWTDRVGPVAALKTLEIMERDQTWDIIPKIGRKVKDIWTRIAEQNNVHITVSGLDSICSFQFNYEDNLSRTFVTQEMLKVNILFNNIFYPSISHNDSQLSIYESHLDQVFFKLKRFQERDELRLALEGRPIETGFGRLVK